MVAAWVMVGTEAVRQPEVRALYQEAVAAELAELTQLVADCCTERRRSTDGAAALAAGLVALMEGAFQLSSAAGDVMPASYAADAAISFAMLGITAAPKA
jgi:TetR/AcrR family transcriptional repressor of bet genes